MQITDSIRSFFLRLKTSKTLSCLWGSTFLPYISSLLMIPLALLKSITFGLLNTPRWACKRYLPVFMLTLNSIEQAWDTLLDHFNMLQEKEAVSLEVADSGSDAFPSLDTASDVGTGAKARVVTFLSDPISGTCPPSPHAVDSSSNQHKKIHGASIISDQKNLLLTPKARPRNANQKVANEKKPPSLLLFLELSVLINLIILPLVWTTRSHGNAVYGLFNRPTSENISMRSSDVSLFIPDMVPESPHAGTILASTSDEAEMLTSNVEDVSSDPVRVSAPIPVLVPMAAAAAADVETLSSDSAFGNDKPLDECLSSSGSSASSHPEEDKEAENVVDTDQADDVLHSVDAPTTLFSCSGPLRGRDVLRFESRGVAEASRILGIPKTVTPEISKSTTEESDMDIEELTSDGEGASLVVSDKIVESFSLEKCIASCSDDLNMTESVQENVDHLLACIENEVSKNGIKFGAMQPFQLQPQDVSSSRNFWDHYDVHSRVHYKFIKKAIKDFTNMVESVLPDLWNIWHSFTMSFEDFFMKTLSFVTCRDGSEYCYIHGGGNKDSTGLQQFDKRIY